MRQYRNFEELMAAPSAVLRFFLDMENFPEEAPLTKESFMLWYGGDVFVVETDEDLKEISTSIADSPERWKSVDEVADSFDQARWLPDESYVVLFMAWNDSGGPSYFVPKEIAERHPTVLESIRLSEMQG